MAVAGAFLAALLLRLAFHDQLGPRFPLVLFTVATLMIHFYFGIVPAAVLAAISLPTGLYLFVPPYSAFDGLEINDLFIVTYYLVSTALLMVLIQHLRRAQYASRLLAEIAESRYMMLLDSESDRAAVEADMRSRDA
jgi:K+-sensing histidine kinase KdpD